MTYKLLTVLMLTVFGTSTFAQLTPTLDDVWVLMRDGDSLQADVYIPAGTDSAEVILIQTPYDKDLFIWSLPMGVGQNLNSQPFIWVIVDWRGFYGSSNADVTNVNRGEDGYDVCEWIVEQIWHKDRIGTWGPSALGGVQYSTAREQHPNHTCAVPLVATPHQSYDSYFTGGVLEKARLETLDALGYGLSPIVLGNVYYSALWQFSESTTWYPEDIQIPTLQIGGWYDHNIDKMIDWYEATRNLAGASVQNEQWLLVGPWVHGGTGAAYVGSSIQGELTYPNAEFVCDTMAWNFLQYYLLDTPNNWQNTDMITYYETGLNTWNTSNATNIETLNSDVLFLDANNRLNSYTGDQNTSFISDPSDPSPTIGGATLHGSLDQGPYNQTSLESRNDIITFSTDVLNNNVSISGRVNVNLFVESDQPDCDISVRLVDVYPGGENMLITDGIARMRFRNGYFLADEAFMTPGSIYNVDIDLPFTNYTWLSGHKIKIFIGGNSSYRWDVNLQNGSTMYAAGDTNIANITVHHDMTYQSKISLPGTNSWLGSSEMDDAIQLTLFPNPTSDVLNIESDAIVESYEIIDNLGRFVRQGNIVNSEITVSNIPVGIYTIRLFNSSESVIRKFLKN